MKLVNCTRHSIDKICDYTRVHEQKTPGFQVSHDIRTSRCWKLQVMVSHLLLSIAAWCRLCSRC